MNRLQLHSGLWFAAAACCIAAPAPESLSGSTLELDYRQAEFSTEVLDSKQSGWVSFAEVRRNHKGAAEAFTTTVLGIKATRRLMPLSEPGKGGIYTYRATAADTVEVDVDMWKAYKADAVRVLTLHFDTPTTATATEGVYHGNYIGSIRNIRVIVRPGAAVAPAPDAELTRMMRELEKRHFPTAQERLYQQRLLGLLQRIAAGEPAGITDSEGKGSTALHCACELSHAELVQWLVEHGADVNARTSSGAAVDDCVCGPNAGKIRVILRRARTGSKR